MAIVNSGAIPAERIVTIGDFVERVYLPWTEQHKRPSTAKGYRDIWEDHLKPLAGKIWLKDARTYHVQGWLDQIGARSLSRNTLKHIKSVVSGIFDFAKQQDYFQGENPARDTASIPRRLSPKRHTHTLSKRFGKFSLFFPSPPPRLLQLRLSWVCGTAKSKDCCGRTTRTARFTFHAPSGTVVPRTRRRVRAARQFQ